MTLQYLGLTAKAAKSNKAAHVCGSEHELTGLVMLPVVCLAFTKRASHIEINGILEVPDLDEVMPILKRFFEYRFRMLRWVTTCKDGFADERPGLRAKDCSDGLSLGIKNFLNVSRH